MTLAMTNDSEVRRHVFEDARALVKEMIDCSKPIISAVNGAAVGAGMVVAVLADISIAASTAVFGDGHTKIGVAAGDHACAIWPLAMGMAKAKLYLLTGELITANAAEKLGLISEVVEANMVMHRAEELALTLAKGPQHALRATKYSLNQWLRHSVLISMDTSMGLEMLNFAESDAKEGIQSFIEKRKPTFPSSL
jgi:enoyl-CoA hydratase